MTAALDVLASLVLADGLRWGDAAEPSQWVDARAVLEGKRRLAYITRPGGASKTTDLAGVGIAALLEQLPPASRSYAVAADRDQAALLIGAIDGFVSRTPTWLSCSAKLPLSASTVRTALTSKFGFTIAGPGRGPHEKYRLYVDGVYMAHMQVSRGSGEIGEGLLGAIARQLGVTRRQVY